MPSRNEHPERRRADDVRATVRGLVLEILDRPDVDTNADLFELGATSMAFLRIVARLHDRFGAVIDAFELERTTVDALSTLVLAKRASEQPSEMESKP